MAMSAEARHVLDSGQDELTDVRFLLYGADIFGQVPDDGENLTLDDIDYVENLEQNFSLPADMKFGEANVYSIVMYSILMVVGLTANSISLYHLIRSVNTAYRPSDRRRSMFLSI